MHSKRLVGALAAIGLVALAAGPVTAAPPATIHAGPAAGLVGPHSPVGELNGAWWHGAKGNAGGGKTRNVPMTYHGGPVMAQSEVTAIFWGPSWANATFAGDKITGLDSLYQGWGGSNYAKTSAEYTDSSGAHVGTGSTYKGNIIDTSTASGGAQTSAILAEVAKQVTAGRIVLRSDGTSYVPVYTDLPRGSAGYCAWHSTGTVNGKRVEFAFFWKLDGDAGCDPVDSTTGHSQGLAALANVSAHELAEAMTDPQHNAWYDGSGAENADKCAWAFNVPSVTLANGTNWKLQGEWSNAAYAAGTGYANRSGQKGCLDGH